ncbi:hypothetical protein DFH11DRAFT_1745790 [Phellopilus nigrolimitatus]|nr:hypothetical protein DFH11DRAFT_1745790 [Phellopilus nigrolimitatus]
MFKCKRKLQYLEFEGNSKLDLKKAPSLKELHDSMAAWNQRAASEKKEKLDYYSLTITDGINPTLVNLELYLYSCTKTTKERTFCCCETSDSCKELNERVETVAQKMLKNWNKLEAYIALP